jgi:two-component system cell cycle response regulator
MFRKILRRYSITSITIGMTLISILLSVGITWGINVFVYKGPLEEGLAISILAPLVIAPLMSVQMLRLIHKLDQTEQQLQVLSHTDELTQTYNRRYFMQYLQQEFQRAQRCAGTFSIAILDMDNFKQINDQWGHLAGDHVLREVTHLFRGQIRQADVFARYGGDEFIFLFPQTNRQEVQIWAERIYAAFAERSIDVENVKIRPLFSIGVAVFEPSVNTLDELLKQADQALYQAKHRGGNQFVQNLN